jgi:hypothetical protein
MINSLKEKVNDLNDKSKLADDLDKETNNLKELNKNLMQNVKQLRDQLAEKQTEIGDQTEKYVMIQITLGTNIILKKGGLKWNSSKGVLTFNLKIITSNIFECPSLEILGISKNLSFSCVFHFFVCHYPFSFKKRKKS